MISSAHYNPQFIALKEASDIGIYATGQKLLDFGCGSGYLAEQYSHEAKKVVAYDLRTYDTWKTIKKVQFTTSIIDVQNEATYDRIIINDVFDHIETPQTWTEALSAYKKNELNSFTPLLTYGGTLTLVIHPWTSRHGAHLPGDKVYYHLTALGSYLDNLNSNKVPLTHMILKAQDYYAKCIEESNLKIINTVVDRKYLEPFEIKHLFPTILHNFRNMAGEYDLLDILSVNKIYFTLTHR